MKVCVKCGLEKPATPEFFHRCAKHSDGLQYKCKQCTAEYIKAYYAEKAEAVRATVAAYKRANPDKVKESQRLSYLANREARLAAERERYHASSEVRAAKIIAAKRSAVARPDAVRENKRRSRSLNPETTRRNRMLRRAKTRATNAVRVSAADVLAKTGGVCFYCSAPISLGTMHVDHMTPLARGGDHVIGNLVPACIPCNRSKFTKTAEEFFAHLRRSSASI